MPYPGFPTDAQAVMMSVATVAKGTTVFVENIFESRYRHVEDLTRLGANIKVANKVAVVEGVGDHGCEYMTGGRVAILGKTGKNFAAGMSGGIAYVLDEDSDLYMRMNKELVSVSVVSEKADILELKNMIEEHVKATDSPKGKEILDNFDEYVSKFKKILPNDYAKMMQTMYAMEEKGMTPEQAKIEAFYINTRK